MKLIKYCKEEHNLTKGCPTIQLGTLEYYRELDPDFYNIADQFEGSYFIDEVTDEMSGKTYKNCRATVPNCNIFCVSTLEVEPDAIDKSYNSKYNINNPGEFYSTIATLLEQQLKISDFTAAYPYLVQNFESNSDLTIKVFGGSDFVNYVGIDHIKRRVKAPEFQNLADQYKKVVYAKNDKFQNDREVRFAFVIYHSALGVISVEAAPKLLSINSKLLNYLD